MSSFRPFVALVAVAVASLGVAQAQSVAPQAPPVQPASAEAARP